MFDDIREQDYRPPSFDSFSTVETFPRRASVTRVVGIKMTLYTSGEVALIDLLIDAADAGSG
jgi:polyphosphate kinase